MRKLINTLKTLEPTPLIALVLVFAVGLIVGQQTTGDVAVVTSNPYKALTLNECVTDWECETAQDFINEDLIPTLVRVLSHFIDWCNAYITNGDRIPDDRIGDIFTIASTASHDYWHELIANNLSYIPALVKETQGGKNVSTALFDAIINTAFDYDMGN